MHDIESLVLFSRVLTLDIRRLYPQTRHSVPAFWSPVKSLRSQHNQAENTLLKHLVIWGVALKTEIANKDNSQDAMASREDGVGFNKADLGGG